MADDVNGAPVIVGQDIPMATTENPTETFNSVSQAARALANARYKKTEPDKPQAKPASAEPAAAAEPVKELAQGADAEPSKEAPGDTAQTDEPAIPAIEPPNAWSADEKERFKTYPPELQAYVAEREQVRDRDLQKHQREAAETRKTLADQLKAAEQVRVQYEQALPALLQTMHDQQQGEFSDIRTMADVEKMAREDWPRYVMWDANQKKIAAVSQEIKATQERQTQERQQNWSKFANEQDKLFAEHVPEMTDKAKASKIAEAAISTLRDIGFTDSELEGLWNSPALRDHRMQLLIHDATRYREAQKTARVSASKTVPPVQRPGASQPRSSDADAQISSLTKRFEQTGNAKDAAALLTARRAEAARRSSN